MSIKTLITAGAAMVVAFSVQAQQDQGMGMHMQHQQAPGAAPVQDARITVHFPEEFRLHTLTNMRDHLLALGEIQEALSREEYEKVGEIAERRLGMSALESHGAFERSQFMPKEMQAIGSEMHHAASRFAVAAHDAAVTGDVKPVLAQLGQLIRQCVACHNGFRVQ